MKKWIVFVLLATLVSLVACKPEVRIIEIEKPVLVEKEVLVEVEKPVIVERYVEAPAGPAEITIAVPEEPPHLDITDAEALFKSFIVFNVYEPLVYPEAGRGLESVLATKWEQVEPNVWRFELRKGVKFHNGVPFNAEVAAWNLNWRRDNAADLRIHYLFATGDFAEAVALDEYTLEIRTSKALPTLPYFLKCTIMVEPGAYLADKTGQTAVGTGPYMLDNWRHGEKIELVANPEYWGGKLDIDKATFVFRSEPAVRAAMQAAGEAEVAAWLTPQYAGPIRTLGVNVAETMFMYFDPNPPLDDVRVRKAICMAMDRNVIADEIFGGYATPANELCPPDCIGYNPNIPVIAYDPEGARKLLAEAEADGVPIDTEITIFGRYGIYPHATETMEALQLWMQDVGLNVKLQMLEVGAWREVNNSYPVPKDRVGMVQSCGSAGVDCLPPLIGYYGCAMKGGYREGCEAYASSEGHGSRRPVLDPKYLELIDAISLLSLEEGRSEAIQETFELTHEYLWACPMGWLKNLMGVSERLDWEPRPDQLILVKEMKLR